MPESFSSSPALDDAVKAILQSEPFDIARNFNVVPLFSDKKKGNAAGRCKLLDPAARAATDIDFIIVINQPIFESLTMEQQAKTLIHECWHIDGKTAEVDGETLWRPKLRKHHPNFCTFGVHEHHESDVTKTFLKIKDQIIPVIEKLPRTTTTMDEFIQAKLEA